MSIYIASDHAGFSLKDFLIHKSGFEFIDLGPPKDSSTDYPDWAKGLVQKVLSDPEGKGILICGSGQGVCIQANRYKGIRAGLCHDLESARLTREHNDANICCLGSRFTPNEMALRIVEVFLKTPFDGGERHVRRVKKLDI